MKGAAYSGLKNVVPINRLCRRHYGFSWGKPFVPGKHDEQRAYFDRWNGKKYTAGILEWPLIKVKHGSTDGSHVADSFRGVL